MPAEWVASAMRLSVVIPCLVTGLVVGGCGSQSSFDPLPAAVTGLQKSISIYDQSSPTDLSSTVSACATGLQSLTRTVQIPSKTDRSSNRRALTDALRQAYTFAKLGFSDCVTGGRTLNYPLMIRSDFELSRANAWLVRARGLDR
jgi:hypothetical protein